MAKGQFRKSLTRDAKNVTTSRRIKEVGKQRRSQGTSREQIALLREAIASSTPSACPAANCENPDFSDFSECETKQNNFTGQQKRMCIEKISSLINLLKHEAEIEHHNFNYEAASKKFRQANSLSQILAKWDGEKRSDNQIYTEYWACLMEAKHALVTGQFDLSKNKFNEVFKIIPKLTTAKFLSYYAPIKSYESYIEAVEHVSMKEFDRAKDKFTYWISMNEHLKTQRKFYYNNIVIFKRICDIISKLSAGNNVEISNWHDLEGFIKKPNTEVSRTTWALWDKFQTVKQAARGNKSGLDEAIKQIANEWKLFLLDTRLQGIDRIAGFIHGNTIFPTFVNILNKIDPSFHNWQGLLLQNLKHLLLILADYEYRRFQSQNELRVAAEYIPSEEKNRDELINAILYFLEHRDKKKKEFFQKALDHLERFKKSITNNSFDDAILAQESFIKAIRWPLVIRIVDKKELSLAEIDSLQPAFEHHCLKLSGETPKEIIFKNPTALKPDSYYYLNPRWNTKSGNLYLTRHQMFYESDMPRWINVFYENMFGRGKVDSKRFHDWILQFEEDERLFACKLLDRLKSYTADEVRDTWQAIFKKLPEEAKSNRVAYIGLGHGAKSGHHLVYPFRQAITETEEYISYQNNGKINQIFPASIADFDKYGWIRPDTIVFIDDFIGTGGQACEFLGWYLTNYQWLKKTNIYFCVLAGFKGAIDEIEKKLEHQFKTFKIIPGLELDKKDIAFSPLNSLWSSDDECNKAEQWAKNLGEKLVPHKQPYDKVRDALGWYNCQALVTFPHNIPSDTLTIFWGDGIKDWMPLIDRHD